MGLEVVRIYKNAAEDTLRVDKITWVPTGNTLNTGIAQRTYARRLYSTTMLMSNIVDRTVAIIEVITNADEIDTAGPPYNYRFVNWNRSSGVVRGDMTDLPVITDNV